MTISNTEQNANNPFQIFCETYIPEIDLFIKEFFQNKKKAVEYQFTEDFYTYLEEFCLREGKRIRPLLLILSYLGYKRGAKNLKEIKKLASVLEIMHSMLLIQDDIIDRSLLRRGEKTIHILCQEHFSKHTNNINIGTDIALVLSDILFTNAIEIISNTKMNIRIKDEFLKIFAWTYELTAWGQILDSINSLPKKIDIQSSDPILISTLKTAHYTILSPMHLGFVLAGKKRREEVNRIKKFSVPLGLAFQIRDDILGVFGTVKETGKPSDSDILEAKYTLLVQDTLKNLNKKDKEDFTQKFTNVKKTKTDIKSIRNYIKKSGALEISTNRLSELVDFSKDNLNQLNIKKEQKIIMSGFIDLIANF